MPDGDSPAAAPRASGSGVVYSSNTVGDHFHEVTIAAAAFSAPPADGLTQATASADAHTHSVTVSMAQLASVAAGQTVKITTGNTEGHMHVITLVKLSAATGIETGGYRSDR